VANQNRQFENRDHSRCSLMFKLGNLQNRMRLQARPFCSPVRQLFAASLCSLTRVYARCASMVIPTINGFSLFSRTFNSPVLPRDCEAHRLATNPLGSVPYSKNIGGVPSHRRTSRRKSQGRDCIGGAKCLLQVSHRLLGQTRTFE
jgi:hypothetical protein